MPTAPRFLEPEIRRVLAHFWRVARARPLHVALPLALTLGAAALEGLSFSLLVPVADAVAGGGFDFLTRSRAFGWILGLLPEGVRSSPAREAWLVLLVLVLVVAARLLKVVFAVAYGAFVHWREGVYKARIQEHTLALTLRFGRQYFDRHSLGKLDVELGWSASVVLLLTAAEGFLRSLLNLVAKLAVLLFISLPLSLTLVVVFPAVIALVGRLTRDIDRLAAAEADVELRTKGQVLDLLATVPLVKASGQERQAVESYGRTLEEGRRLARRRRDLMELRWNVEEILVIGSVLIAQGVVTVAAGTFDPGSLARLAVFLLVIQQSLGDLKGLGAFRNTLAEHRPKLRALARLLSDEDKHVVASGPRTFTGLARGISIRDLTFGYERTPVLRGISAEIPARSFTAVVGESGAGKSTLIDLLSRFYECPPGTILLDGTDIREFSLSSLYRRVAIVSQEVWILNRTLRENLVYGLEEPPSDQELVALLADLQMDLLREHARPLDLLLGDRGVQLSGGQKQRVAIARALLRDPELLILDEATSALDSALESRVADAVERRFRDRTLLVIAHRLSTVRHADRILVLRDGRLVEQGGWDELVAARGEFARLHDAQFEKAPA